MKELTLLEALRMSHGKWIKCAKITEKRFRAYVYGDIYCDPILGLTDKGCGLCMKYRKSPPATQWHCPNCPLDDSDITCCNEWYAAYRAFQKKNYPAYHTAAVALRDRLARLIEEEESDE